MASSSTRHSIADDNIENDDSQQRVPDGSKIVEIRDMADYPPFCFILTNDARFIRRNRQVIMTNSKETFN